MTCGARGREKNEIPDGRDRGVGVAGMGGGGKRKGKKGFFLAIGEETGKKGGNKMWLWSVFGLGAAGRGGWGAIPQVDQGIQGSVRGVPFCGGRFSQGGGEIFLGGSEGGGHRRSSFLWVQN